MSASARWVHPEGFLIDLSTLLINSDGRSAVALNRCHQFDAALPVPVVVPVDEHDYQQTGLLFMCKRLARSIGPLLHCPDQGFSVWVLV